ncbi:hypothetical protein [uncultured Selenomonas sp.]|uniref:hypothetical protein n=1 Tax=uncultured Selenomonas sp. TaxID=159275 RepID=UPI0028E710E5|nr:hypothetical protein [uncultured Selenomonas sp.]
MTRKICCSLVLLSSLLLASLPSYGVCAATPNPQESTVSMSSEDLTRLSEISRAQEKALRESAQDLMTARAALNESNEALTKAKQELAASQETLTHSRQETAQLLNELSAQRQEIAALKQRLNALSSESQNAESALQRANESLQNTRLEFRKNEEEHARRERHLKNKIIVWQVVAVILGGVALSK